MRIGRLVFRAPFRVLDITAAEQHGADGQLAVKPTTSLVDRFADKVRWELIGKLFFEIGRAHV